IADSDAWHNYINFRDYLNTHKEEARRYEELKLELCSKFPNDRESYVTGKSVLVSGLLEKARLWRMQVN
ncbi:MAG: GrpB family protein, partial [Treponema sp.]|nr:GrpB family protein [Treponema sp.]